MHGKRRLRSLRYARPRFLARHGPGPHSLLEIRATSVAACVLNLQAEVARLKAEVMEVRSLLEDGRNRATSAAQEASAKLEVTVGMVVEIGYDFLVFLRVLFQICCEDCTSICGAISHLLVSKSHWTRVVNILHGDLLLNSGCRGFSLTQVPTAVRSNQSSLTFSINLPGTR